jgi:hypothetical protein
MCHHVTENLQKCAQRDPAAGIAATTRIVAPTGKTMAVTETKKITPSAM